MTMASNGGRYLDKLLTASYAAAKAGVIQFTRHVAKELGPHGIRVNSIAPATVSSERVERIMDDEPRARSPRCRRSGGSARREDCALATLFLVSDSAALADRRHARRRRRPDHALSRRPPGSAMPSLTTAEAVIARLEAHGVRHVFGIPGTHNLPLYRCLADSSIEHVTPRHEQGAGYAADGYARSGGRPAVCLATSGPAVSTSTAAATAHADSVPMLILAPGMSELRGRAGHRPSARGSATSAARWSGSRLSGQGPRARRRPPPRSTRLSRLRGGPPAAGLRRDPARRVRRAGAVRTPSGARGRPRPRPRAGPARRRSSPEPSAPRSSSGAAPSGAGGRRSSWRGARRAR